MPITSPVERISGPSIVSTPGKRANGKTASFTEMCRGRGVAEGARLREASCPTMQSAPAFASGRPVALPTKGTVRLARGFTSRT